MSSLSLPTVAPLQPWELLHLVRRAPAELGLPAPAIFHRHARGPEIALLAGGNPTARPRSRRSA